MRQALRGLTAARVGLVIWAGVIMWSSLTPVSSVPMASSAPDTLLHAVGYAVLAALLVFSMRRPRPSIVVLGVLAFGLLMEVLQRMTGYRSFEWTDLLADGVGAAVGVLAAMIARTAVSNRP